MRREELGVKAERVPPSGAARYRANRADNDIYALADAAPLVIRVHRAEVRA
jgi:hypothetical protein